MLYIILVQNLFNKLIKIFKNIKLGSIKKTKNSI
jgi:hypothetical protein